MKPLPLVELGAFIHPRSPFRSERQRGLGRRSLAADFLNGAGFPRGPQITHRGKLDWRRMINPPHRRSAPVSSKADIERRSTSGNCVRPISPRGARNDAVTRPDRPLPLRGRDASGDRRYTRGRAFDLASDPIANQTLDPAAWRSMDKGPVCMSMSIAPEQRWAFARAIAYDRYLPNVVLGHVHSMQKAGEIQGPCEVVYFPDAIGILHDTCWPRNEQGALQCPDAHMCLITRDIQRPDDFIRRNDTFERTLWRWLDHLHAKTVPCNGLKLPRSSISSAPLEVAQLTPNQTTRKAA